MTENVLAVPKPIEFSNLPVDILNSIVEFLSMKDRLIVRKVSSNLRDIIDHQKVNVFNLEIISDLHGISRLNLNFAHIQYAEENRDEALQDLKISLKLAKKIERFEFEGSSALIPELSRQFVDQILARIVKINADQALSILSIFKSGFLEKINLRAPNRQGNILALLDTEHFKNSKILEIENFGIFPYEALPQLLHLEQFRITVLTIRGQDVIYLRDALLESRTSLKYCSLTMPGFINTVEVARAIGAQPEDGFDDDGRDDPNRSIFLNFENTVKVAISPNFVKIFK